MSIDTNVEALGSIDTLLGDHAGFDCMMSGRTYHFNGVRPFGDFLAASLPLSKSWFAGEDTSAIESASSAILELSHRYIQNIAEDSDDILPSLLRDFTETLSLIRNAIRGMVFHALNPVATLLSPNEDVASYFTYNRKLATMVRELHNNPSALKKPGHRAFSDGELMDISTVQVVAMLAEAGVLHNLNPSDVANSVHQLDVRLSGCVKECGNMKGQLEAVLAERVTAEPAENWSKQRDWHEKEAADALRRMKHSIWITIGVTVAYVAVGFMIAVLIGLSKLFGFYEIPAADQIQIHVQLIIMGVVGIGIMIWLIRLNARYYTSHSHMVRISKEKIAMVNTFVTFSNQKIIDASQWGIVLAAIFRDTPDGLVQMPDGPHSPSDMLFAIASAAAKSS